MSEPALVAQHLRKSYRVGHIFPRLRPALLDVSLTVERGEIFGYLGPNGSGKSTTLKILMGLVERDSGMATVLGRPLEDPAWKQHAGYLPEQPYFYDYLTAVEYVEYAGRLFGLGAAERRARARRLLDWVELGDERNMALRHFSKGMLQRLGLAQALVNDPEIVFLDEPMSGLDPLGRHLVRELILDLKARGKTVFFSTHILPDAEALCDRVAVLDRGRLLQVGRLDELLRLDVNSVEVLASGGDLSTGVAPPGVCSVRSLGERWRLDVAEAELLPALQWVLDRGARVLAVQPVRQSLEDYFFNELRRAPRAE